MSVGSLTGMGEGAGFVVTIEYADGLEVGVDEGGANKLHTAPFEVCGDGF